MNIIFSKKHIYDAPLDILKHLYYYTVQYGLSVAQFTGKNPEYWRQLPYVLKEYIGDEKALVKIINELEKVSGRHNARLERRREQMKTGWAQKEIVLNAQLDSLLLSLPGSILAEVFQRIAPIISKDIPDEYNVVRVEIKGNGGRNMDFVEPDLLLKGEKQLLMIELKTKGWAQSSRKYPPGQLLNYLRLVMEYERFGEEKINSFAHLILVPTDDLVWLEDGSEWVRKYNKATGVLTVDYDTCFKLAGKSKKVEKELRNFVTRQGKNIPIYYRSWEQMSIGFEQVIRQKRNDEYQSHWENISKELKELAKRASKSA